MPEREKESSSLACGHGAKPMLETSAVSATFKLRGHEDPNELWPGVEIETTTAEATNQYYVNAIAPMAVRLGVWPGIPLEA